MRKILAGLALCLMSAGVANAADITPGNAAPAFNKVANDIFLKKIKLENFLNPIKQNCRQTEKDYVCKYKLGKTNILLYAGAPEQNSKINSYVMYLTNSNDVYHYVMAVETLTKLIDPEKNQEELDRIEQKLLHVAVSKKSTAELLDNGVLVSDYDPNIGLSITATNLR